MGRVDRLTQTFFSRYYRWEIAAGEPVAAIAREELERRLPAIASESWPERFRLGGVYVAGRSASVETPIVPPCRLEYYDPVCPIERVAEVYPRFDPSMILYRDDDLGVAWKPAGLPSTPPRDQRLFNIQRHLSDHIGASVHIPSRLDVGVSGLMLFSLSARMNRHLQKVYDRKLMQKHYLTEIAEPWTGEACIRANIARDPRHAVLRRTVSEGGVSAITLVHGVTPFSREGSARALLHVEPVTGRTHQIRVHLASSGVPIVGDPYYGGIEAPEVRLVSYALRLYHPYKKTMISFELPESVWPRWLSEAERISGGFSFSYREERRHEGDSY